VIAVSPADAARSVERDGYAIVRGIVPPDVIASIGSFLAAAEPAAIANAAVDERARRLCDQRVKG